RAVGVLTSRSYLLLSVFFFQAEDGIRDWSVTGVQTCALPIFVRSTSRRPSCPSRAEPHLPRNERALLTHRQPAAHAAQVTIASRSEERRVGKECRSRGAPNH